MTDDAAPLVAVRSRDSGSPWWWSLRIGHGLSRWVA